jgi:hypothetical protein
MTYPISAEPEGPITDDNGDELEHGEPDPAPENRRREWPRAEPPVPGETSREARERRERNRQVRADREHWDMARCRCGLARVNVVHEMDPASAPEGPDYYADFEQHPFEPAL